MDAPKSLGPAVGLVASVSFSLDLSPSAAGLGPPKRLAPAVAVPAPDVVVVVVVPGAAAVVLVVAG